MQKQITVNDRTFEAYISARKIQERVAEMGQEITRRYQGKRPLFLPVLNGAFVFAADLIRSCDMELDLSFVKLTSYKGTESSGQVQTLMGLKEDVRNRHLIIVEDIVDTGRTLSSFIPMLQKMEPASVALASLLVKPDAMEFPLKVDFQGFEIPTRFVIGYGLDYDGLARNLPDIYQLSE